MTEANHSSSRANHSRCSLGIGIENAHIHMHTYILEHAHSNIHKTCAHKHTAAIIVLNVDNWKHAAVETAADAAARAGAYVHQLLAGVCALVSLHMECASYSIDKYVHVAGALWDLDEHIHIVEHVNNCGSWISHIINVYQTFSVAAHNLEEFLGTQSGGIVWLHTISRNSSDAGSIDSRYWNNIFTHLR